MCVCDSSVYSISFSAIYEAPQFTSHTELRYDTVDFSVTNNTVESFCENLNEIRRST